MLIYDSIPIELSNTVSLQSSSITLMHDVLSETNITT